MLEREKNRLRDLSFKLYIIEEIIVVINFDVIYIIWLMSKVWMLSDDWWVGP